MIVTVPIELDNSTAERVDAMLRRYGDKCTSARAVSDFFADLDMEGFARSMARALLADRLRDELDQD
jgi:hypothetical protein